MYIRTSPKSAQTYQFAEGRSGDHEGEKGEIAEKHEDRKGYGPGAGDGSDQTGGAEPCSCTERN